MNLQIVGAIDSGAANRRLVEKEFGRFHQTQSRGFDNFTYKTIGKNGLTGEVYNYFISPFSVSPVTTAWGPLPGSGQYCFTITIRFQVSENLATYITKSGDSKGL